MKSVESENVPNNIYKVNYQNMTSSNFRLED